MTHPSFESPSEVPSKSLRAGNKDQENVIIPALRSSTQPKTSCGVWTELIFSPYNFRETVMRKNVRWGISACREISHPVPDSAESQANRTDVEKKKKAGR